MNFSSKHDFFLCHNRVPRFLSLSVLYEIVNGFVSLFYFYWNSIEKRLKRESEWLRAEKELRPWMLPPNIKHRVHWSSIWIIVSSSTRLIFNHIFFLTSPPVLYSRAWRRNRRRRTCAHYPSAKVPTPSTVASLPHGHLTSLPPLSDLPDLRHQVRYWIR